jgi:uncharacterized protein (TIGR04255 family)
MFGLEPAPKYRLSRSPLAQAFGQVRFPIRAQLQSLEGVAPVQERIEHLFPYLNAQQMQQVSLLVGPAGPAAAGGQVSKSWRFNDDAGWSLVLSADTATLAVGPEYGEFAEFSDRFEAVLSALGEGAGVTRANRLGVRYVNIAEVPPTEPDAWRSWFRPELTGWSVTNVVAEGTNLLTSITQTQLAAPPRGELAGPPVDIQAMVRHGFIPANTMVPGVLPRQPQSAAYLLDIDLFVDAPQAFDAEELSRQLTMLHEQIDRFFYWSIAPDGEDYFGVEVLS